MRYLFSELLLAAPVASGGWFEDGEDDDTAFDVGFEVVLLLWLEVVVGEVPRTEEVSEAVAGTLEMTERVVAERTWEN